VLVRDVVRGLLAEPDAAASVPAGVVTDTLKWVDGDEVVVGTADRASYAVVSSPQAYRRASLAAALAGADDETLRAQGAEVLPRLVQAGGGLVRLVPSPGEALRVATRQHIVLAEVLLQVGATGEGVS
jgi:2-C-methyl-D-erythritol 4-phosphate cytidylyltransferase